MMPPEPLPSPDATPDPLEARLRALPAPAVPAALEARLLAAIPKAKPASPWRWSARLGLAGAVTAACVLALLGWLWRESQQPIPNTTPNELPYVKSAGLADGIGRMAAWQEARSTREETDPGIFVWPLPEARPVVAWNSIPADILD
jgi:hypothetical protein